MRHDIEQCRGEEAEEQPAVAEISRFAGSFASENLIPLSHLIASLDVRERQQPGGQIAQNSGEAESRYIDKKKHSRLDCPSAEQDDHCGGNAKLVIGRIHPRMKPHYARPLRKHTRQKEEGPNDSPFSYTVKTIPPLSTSLANLGVAPRQNRNTPSSLRIRAAQWNELRYCVRASSDCIRVLITLHTATSRGQLL